MLRDALYNVNKKLNANFIINTYRIALTLRRRNIQLLLFLWLTAAAVAASSLQRSLACCIFCRAVILTVPLAVVELYCLVFMTKTHLNVNLFGYWR